MEAGDGFQPAEPKGFCAFRGQSDYCGSAQTCAWRNPRGDGPPAHLAHARSNSPTAARPNGCRSAARRFAGRWVPALLLGASLAGWALEPTTPLPGYGRQSWVMENGLPQNTVQTLTQTRQGFVWLGTEAGLVRFDGNSFAVFDRNSTPALPGSDIRCLLQTADGALWIGTSEGLARWKDGTVTAFGTQSGLPGDWVRALVQTTKGALWAWTDLGLARLDGDRFTAASAAGGLPSGAITSLVADSEDGLWVATTQGAAVFRNGQWSAARPAARAGQDGPYRVAPGPGGAILLADSSGVFQQAAGRWTELAAAATLPEGGVRFMQPLPESELALASASQVVIERGGHAVQRLSAGHEIPGSRIQAAVFGSRRLPVDRHQRRAGAAGPTASCNGCRSPIRWPALRFCRCWKTAKATCGWAPRPAGCTFCATSGSATSARARASPQTTRPPWWRTSAGTLWVGTSGGGLNALQWTPNGPGSTQSLHRARRAAERRDSVAGRRRPTAIFGWARRTG